MFTRLIYKIILILSIPKHNTIRNLNQTFVSRLNPKYIQVCLNNSLARITMKKIVIVLVIPASIIKLFYVNYKNLIYNL